MGVILSQPRVQGQGQLTSAWNTGEVTSLCGWLSPPAWKAVLGEQGEAPHLCIPELISVQ